MSNPAIKTMSTKDMERTVIDILIDNGMSTDQATKTAMNMSTRDMQNYLETSQTNPRKTKL